MKFFAMNALFNNKYRNVVVESVLPTEAEIIEVIVGGKLRFPHTAASQTHITQQYINLKNLKPEAFVGWPIQQTLELPI